jgi:carbamate kinase
MHLVIALGGNALLERGEPLDAAVQQRNVARAAAVLGQIAKDHDIVVTHGNGPQIGLLALQAAAYRDVAPYPLDVLGAESEGMIGYLIEQELASVLPGREVATLLTQVEVDPHDPAFQNPTKPIGPVYNQSTAQRLAGASNWTLVPDGAGFRRAVPSPEPKRILEMPTIRRLARDRVIVICAGGGGIPVIRMPSGALHGVAAVIDKDLSSALLAIEISANGLLMLTDVPAVYDDWNGTNPRAIRTAAPGSLRRLSFAAGSMGPKIEAACRFVERTGGWAGIGALQDGAAIITGESGTRVQTGDDAIHYWDD